MARHCQGDLPAIGIVRTQDIVESVVAFTLNEDNSLLNVLPMANKRN